MRINVLEYKFRRFSLAHVLLRTPCGPAKQHFYTQVSFVDPLFLASALFARMRLEISRRRAIASAVKRPCLRAFLFPLGGPGDFPPRRVRAAWAMYAPSARAT